MRYTNRRLPLPLQGRKMTTYGSNLEIARCAAYRVGHRDDISSCLTEIMSFQHHKQPQTQHSINYGRPL